MSMLVIGTKYKVNCTLLCTQIVENEWLRVYVTHGAVLPQNYIHWKSCKVGYTQSKLMHLWWQDAILKMNVLGGKNLWAPTQCHIISNIIILVPQHVIHDVHSSVSPAYTTPPTKPSNHPHCFQITQFRQCSAGTCSTLWSTTVQ